MGNANVRDSIVDTTMFVSVTRLRLRSVRFLLLFAIYAVRSTAQVKRAAGFLKGSLLPDGGRTFWTLTAWENQESMRRYMTAGAHRDAMPRLLNWCDEASVVHWDQDEPLLPTWAEADRRMREQGRPSKVRNPSPRHADLSYSPPSTGGGKSIARAR
jgi:heme-degrading monooxygenase HmoA